MRGVRGYLHVTDYPTPRAPIAWRTHGDAQQASFPQNRAGAPSSPSFFQGGVDAGWGFPETGTWQEQVPVLCHAAAPGKFEASFFSAVKADHQFVSARISCQKKNMENEFAPPGAPPPEIESVDIQSVC